MKGTLEVRGAGGVEGGQELLLAVVDDLAGSREKGHPEGGQNNRVLAAIVWLCPAFDGKVRYDNLKAAVAQVIGFSRQRVEAERWTAFRSHFDLDAFYCQPGITGAHEKGGVEGDIGRFRREPNHRRRQGPRSLVTKRPLQA